MSGAFDLYAPTDERERPLLVEVPHAGLAIPDAVRAEITAPKEAILRDADLYVDKLYARTRETTASLLVANISRYVVDLNRAPDDVDLSTVPDHPAPRGAQPRGVVWRVTTDGQPALAAPLTYAKLRARLDRYHTPYHETLATTLARLRSRHGYAILLAGHSMPSVGRAGHTDPGAKRADVVPGTRGRTTASSRIIDLVDAHFRDAGLVVRHDDPYKGGFTTQHYGRPREGFHAIQIELSRALYMDEETGQPRKSDFEKLSDVLMALVAKLAVVAP